MTIEVKQTCNGCGAERELEIYTQMGEQTVANAAEKNGWREPRKGKHLCPPCIDKALEGDTAQKEAARAAG